MDECEQQLHEETQAYNQQHPSPEKVFNMTCDQSSTTNLDSSPPAAPLSAANNCGLESSHGELIPESAIELALRTSLHTGRFSDLAVVHGVRNWKAHKLVVCSQSTVLESMIQKQLSPPTDVLNLSAYSYEPICMLMEYLYASNYSAPEIEPDFSLPLHLKVFNLASAFEIESLKTTAATHFKHNLNHYVTNLDVYLTIVKTIYSTSTNEAPGLRVVVVDAAVVEINNLLSEAVKPSFMKLLADLPNFLADVLLSLAKNPVRPLEAAFQELCDKCGPRPDDDPYTVEQVCKKCNKDRTLEFY